MHANIEEKNGKIFSHMSPRGSNKYNMIAGIKDLDANQQEEEGLVDGRCKDGIASAFGTQAGLPPHCQLLAVPSMGRSQYSKFLHLVPKFHNFDIFDFRDVKSICGDIINFVLGSCLTEKQGADLEMMRTAFAVQVSICYCNFIFAYFNYFDSYII